jgi:hypothetical protein
VVDGAHQQQQRAVEAIRRSGGIIYYDYEFLYGYAHNRRKPSTPDWLLRRLGPDYFHAVTAVHFRFPMAVASDESIEPIRGLAQLKYLYVSGPGVGDAALAVLEGTPRLESLHLPNTRVSDEGLASCGRLSRLQFLDLTGTHVGDEGLSRIRGLCRIEHLSLDGTRVGNAGLAHIGGLPQLRKLSLLGTQVDDAGLIHLRGLSGLRMLRVGRTGTLQEEAFTWDEESLASLKQEKAKAPDTAVSLEAALELQRSLPKLRIAW